MALRVDIKLPRFVQRGEDATLDLPIRDASDAVQTATSGTLTITVGSKVLVDAAPLSTFGPPLTYALDASTTEDEALSDEWLEVWDTDIGTFRQSGYLVRHVYRSRVTERDLLARHDDLLNQLPPGVDSTEPYRTLAHEKMQRRLLKLGRRPWLIFDPHMLLDAEVALALHLWACDAAQRFQDAAPFLRMKKDFRTEYDSEWGDVTFRYDEGQTGTLDNGRMREAAASSGVTMAATRPRSARGFQLYGRGW